jgi:hypothetical protein
MYAVIKIAGANKGSILSKHRTFWAAMKACPACFYTVRKIG